MPIATRRGLLLSACLACAFLMTACGRSSPEDRLGSAKAIHAKGDRNAAIVHLKSALQYDAEHGPTRFYLGTLYSEAGDYRSAEKEFRRALELKVDPARVLPWLGNALVMQGEAKKALAEVTTDGIADPDSLAGILSARGMAQLSLRKLEDARKSFDEATRIRPDSSEAMLGRARVFASEQNLEAGLAEVNRAVQASPTNREALMLKGDFLRSLRRDDESREAYEQVLAREAGYAPALLALVSLDLVTGRLDVASSRLAKEQKALAGNPMASYLQALLAFKNGDFAKSRDAIQLVLKSAPNHVPSLLLGAAVELAHGSHELAQARLRYVLERVPDNLYARRLLIASYLRTSQTQKAIEVIEPVLKRDIKDPTLLALAGEVQMQLNDFGKAKGYFEAAAKLDPKNAVMRTGLGLIRLAAGEIELATADLESASQLDQTRHQADVLLISTYLQRGQFDQALKAGHLLLQKQPDNPMGHNLVAAAYIGKKDISGARRSLERALEIQAGYTPAAANLAELDLQGGDKRSARRRFESIIAKEPKNAQAYMMLAALGPRVDATREEMKGWLEAAKKASPGAIQPLVMLARFYFQLNEPKNALELVDQVLAAAPEKPEVLELAGQVQLAAGEKNRAISTYSRWATLQPHSAMAWYRLATAQLANEDINGAIGSMRKSLDARPAFPEAQILLAQTESRRGRIDEALKVAAGLQQQSRNSPVGWLVEGDVRMVAKQFGAASRAYETGYAMQRTGSTALKIHAAMAKDGRSAEGEARLREWLKHEPGDLSTRLYIADVYIKDGKFKKAIDEYEYVLTKDPDNVIVLNNLAWCYQQVKDRRAVETAQRAIRLKADDPAVIDTLGWVLVENGDLAGGIQFLRKATGLAPKSPDFRFHLAQGLMKSGDKDTARAELERLLVEHPNFTEHDAAMKLLAQLRK